MLDQFDDFLTGQYAMTTPQPSRPGNQVGLGCRWMILVAVAAALLFHPGWVGAVHAQGETTVHVVRSGETLSSIAAQYGISYIELGRYNRLRNFDFLRVGQRLRLPPRARTRPTQAPTPVVTPPPTRRPTRGATNMPTQPPSRHTSAVGRGEILYAVRLYTVRSGDTLSGIAANFGIALSSLIRRNRLLPSSTIYVGQRLIIPARARPTAWPTATPASPATARTSTKPTPEVTPILLEPTPETISSR